MNRQNEPSELGDSLRAMVRDELHEREASELVIDIEQLRKRDEGALPAKRRQR